MFVHLWTCSCITIPEKPTAMSNSTPAVSAFFLSSTPKIVDDGTNNNNNVGHSACHDSGMGRTLIGEKLHLDMMSGITMRRFSSKSSTEIIDPGTIPAEDPWAATITNVQQHPDCNDLFHEVRDTGHKAGRGLGKESAEGLYDREHHTQKATFTGRSCVHSQAQAPWDFAAPTRKGTTPEAQGTGTLAAPIRNRSRITITKLGTAYSTSLSPHRIHIAITVLMILGQRP